jgi:putative flippase GtrA
VASSFGFALSIAVSYVAQRRWVFADTVRVRSSLPRFLGVVAVGFSLNAAIVWFGTEMLAAHYAGAQAVAFVLVPLSNYLLNGLWTFRSRDRGPVLEP